MSTPQTNFGLNNNARMGKLIPKIERIFGHVLVYSIIISVTISALFGGIVLYPFYFVFYIFNKMKASNGIQSANGIDASANGIQSANANEIDANEIEEEQFMNPIIDETWCNVSVKNIINYKAEEEEEEILSLKMPSNEEESEGEESEEKEYDDSDDDRYSCRYKSGL